MELQLNNKFNQMTNKLNDLDAALDKKLCNKLERVNTRVDSINKDIIQRLNTQPPQNNYNNNNNNNNTVINDNKISMGNLASMAAVVGNMVAVCQGVRAPVPLLQQQPQYYLQQPSVHQQQQQSFMPQGQLMGSTPAVLSPQQLLQQPTTMMQQLPTSHQQQPQQQQQHNTAHNRNINIKQQQ